jgi:hypothetical protein
MTGTALTITTLTTPRIPVHTTSLLIRIIILPLTTLLGTTLKNRIARDLVNLPRLAQMAPSSL